MFGTLDISTSGLIAQRQRMEVIASNMANRNTIYDAHGKYAPFRRRIAVLGAGDPTTGKAQGVHVEQIKLDDSPLRAVFDPDNPNADGDGNVFYPTIDPAMEMVNALDASRAYEANITAAEAAKSMMQSSLRLLA